MGDAQPAWCFAQTFLWGWSSLVAVFQVRPFLFAAWVFLPLKVGTGTYAQA
jgi:hypothetical protein